MSRVPHAVSPEEIVDLKERLRRFRRPLVAADDDRTRGIDLDRLSALIAYWADHFDWTLQEDRIRALPWELVDGDRPLRVIHQRAETPSAPTVLLLHGWPDSVLRFERLLPRLRDVNVVIPALPGFPFAAPIAEAGLSSRRMAEVVCAAMVELGYPRFTISAGDVGCDVAEAIAGTAPERVASLHLTDVSQYHFLVDPPADLSPAEEAYLQSGHAWQAAEGGYMHEQSTKPHTLAAALDDSPAGLAAWILEKLDGWTDGGAHDEIFTCDEILTWISAYWFDHCIGTSFTPYAETGAKPWPRVQSPTVFTIFAKDLVNAPREFAERFFRVEGWVEHPRGGHFAAWERPDEYVAGLRQALDLG